jgi:hypothetical protein
MLWARGIRKQNFQNSGIEMIKGWESLQMNSLVPKTQSPGYRKPEGRKSRNAENESFENPKIAEPSRARKSREIERFS